MEETAIDVSVIIPVYNPPHEAFVGLCESLTGQSGRHEFIFVNDGSTDAFAQETLAEYSRRDSRVRVINAENGGASVARNAGLAVARGEYIAFADADDEYLPSALSLMLGYAHETKADVAVFGNLVDGTPYDCRRTRHVLNEKQQRELVLSTIRQLDFSAPQHGFMHSTPWAKLFRRRMVVENEIRFPVGSTFSEDAAFCLYAYDSASSTAVDTAPVYNWHTVANSTSRAVVALSRVGCLLHYPAVCETFVAKRHANDKEFEETLPICALFALLQVDRRCIQPALSADGQEREARRVWLDVFREPAVRRAIRRLNVRMLTRYTGWGREYWGQILRVMLFAHCGEGIYFSLLALRERIARHKKM